MVSGLLIPEIHDMNFWGRTLDRIMFSRNHYLVPAKHVNPIDIKLLEQIHRVGWIAQAIPSNPDLL